MAGIDGSILGYDSFTGIVTRVARAVEADGLGSSEERLEAIVSSVMDHADGTLDDDFGLLEAVFV